MIEFRKATDFPRGTLYNQLVDAYSFNADCQKTWDTPFSDKYINYEIDLMADKTEQ